MSDGTSSRGRRVLIFGGAGFIGTHLARAELTRGAKVTVADVHLPTDRVEGVDYLRCDVRDQVDIDDAADVVFNLAAVHRTPGHPDHQYYDTNIAGALNVTEWCARRGVRELCFTSSISVYGPTEEPRDERSPLLPASAYGRSKALAETIHRRWVAEGEGRRLAIVRPAVIFGPGEGGNFTRLASALERGRFAYPGRVDTIKACGYVSDLVRSFDLALEQAAPIFVYNFAYPAQYTIRDICEAFSRVAGYRLPHRIPAELVDVGVSGLRAISKVSRSQRLDPARIKKLTNSTNIVPRALREAGFEWETDLVGALELWLQSEPRGRFV